MPAYSVLIDIVVLSLSKDHGLLLVSINVLHALVNTDMRCFGY